MDLGKRGTGMKGLYDGLSTAELLSVVSDEVRGRKASQVREWIAIIAWADQHVVEAPEQAATILDGVLDTGVPIAGPGAPLVSEFGLMELIATLERTPDGGRAYVGQVVECAWRLPKLNAQVLEGRCPTWRAAQVADLTRALSPEAAAWVDAQIAFAAGTCSWAQVGRLVAEAVARFDPDLAEAQRNEAADARHFDIDTHQAGTSGITGLAGLVGVCTGCWMLPTPRTSTTPSAGAPRSWASWVTTAPWTSAAQSRPGSSPGPTSPWTWRSWTRRPGRSPSPPPAARPSCTSTSPTPPSPARPAGKAAWAATPTPRPRSSPHRSANGCSPAPAWWCGR